MKGGSFSVMLTLLFIALKLIGVISWSWWWVLSPIWISLIVAVFILIPAYLIFKYHDEYHGKKRKL